MEDSTNQNTNDEMKAADHHRTVLSAGLESGAGLLSAQQKLRAISPARWLPLLFVCWLGAVAAPAQEPGNPLKPPDRSSPRAALKTFLDAGDAVGQFLVHEYLPSPSREKYLRLASLAETGVRALDLSEMPSAPSARLAIARRWPCTMF
jgi:hypothetical protein